MRRIRPALVAKDESHLTGDRTGPIQSVAPPEPQGCQPGFGVPIVAGVVPETPGPFVPGAAIQFDNSAELGVPHIGLPGTDGTLLSLGLGQPVGSFDLMQIVPLQRRADAVAHVGEQFREPLAIWVPGTVSQGGSQIVRVDTTASYRLGKKSDQVIGPLGRGEIEDSVDDGRSRWNAHQESVPALEDPWIAIAHLPAVRQPDRDRVGSRHQPVQMTRCGQSEPGSWACQQ